MQYLAASSGHCATYPCSATRATHRAVDKHGVLRLQRAEDDDELLDCGVDRPAQAIQRRATPCMPPPPAPATSNTVQGCSKAWRTDWCIVWTPTALSDWILHRAIWLRVGQPVESGDSTAPRDVVGYHSVKTFDDDVRLQPICAQRLVTHGVLTCVSPQPRHAQQQGPTTHHLTRSHNRAVHRVAHLPPVPLGAPRHACAVQNTSQGQVHSR
eukprot:m.1111070 g.1111070  ORF g.1111070 m.1111070 type:complete len:212 (+) comp24361_c0_seq17:2476-3111(+)